MNNENLFRMNFIIQDSNATTVETNLVKIVEAVLFDTQDEKLSLFQIVEQIKKECDLDFSEEEVKNAIAKRGNHIQLIDDYYVLKPAYREKISKQEPFDKKMSRLVNKAINECDLQVTEGYLSNLLINYLYYCFNTNKAAILSLLNNTPQGVDKLNYKEDDIKLINTFLDWDNEEKNKFVYSTVSCGYIYCSLTIKKNDIFANELFRGKVFVLDANIIFRLAGINNKSRMQTIESFVSKCREVGVKLCYTTETLDEIQRVIISRVHWIKNIIGGEEPLDVSQYDYANNDFYKIYYDWTRMKGNRYNDFQGFSSYIKDLIYGVIDRLTVIESPNYEIENPDEFESYTYSLQHYKNEHINRETSIASIKTDVNNFLYLKNQRKKNESKNENESLWMTNDFFISADQNLISWSMEANKGVPIIELPSVWLTIMLRFSGRTDNDYKAFCTFLELRTHLPENLIDVYDLMESLAEKTNDNDLKKIIIQEVFDHKDDYEDLNTDYSQMADKAFDTIRNKEEKSLESKVNYLKGECKNAKKTIDDIQSKNEIEKEDKINRLVERDSKKHFKFIIGLNKYKYVIAVLLIVVFVMITILTVSRVGIIYQLSYSMNIDVMGVLGLLWAILVVLVPLSGHLIEYLASEDKIAKYKEKRRKYYKEA